MIWHDIEQQQQTTAPIEAHLALLLALGPAYRIIRDEDGEDSALEVVRRKHDRSMVEA